MQSPNNELSLYAITINNSWGREQCNVPRVLL